MHHMKNSKIRSLWNPEDGPTRRSNQNVQIVGKRNLKITSFGWILWEVNHDVRTNVRRINEPQYKIIATSNELTNQKDWITKMSKESRSRICTYKPLTAQKPYTNEQPALSAKVVQPTKRRICIHKLLNVQKPYKLRKAAYIAQSPIQLCAKAVQPTWSCIQLRTQTGTDAFEQINK